MACCGLSALLYRSYCQQARLAGLLARREAEFADMVSGRAGEEGMEMCPCCSACMQFVDAGMLALFPLPALALLDRPPARTHTLPAPLPLQLMRVAQLQRNISTHRGHLPPMLRHVAGGTCGAHVATVAAAAHWPALVVV